MIDNRQIHDTHQNTLNFIYNTKTQKYSKKVKKVKNLKNILKLFLRL